MKKSRPFSVIHSLKLALLLCGVTAAAPAARALTAQLQGLSYGSNVWQSGNLTGWKELDLIPCRMWFTGGPASNQTFLVEFDHTKTSGGKLLPGIQNLLYFSNSPNVVVISAPTLSSPAGVDTWSYTFTVNFSGGATNEGWVEFRARLAAGSHIFGGSSLALKGSPSAGVLQISKPGPGPGNPDLVLTKTGPSLANPGSLVTYTLTYTNKAGSATTGAQLTDVLPGMVTMTNCTGGCYLVGNTATWDLGDIPRGGSGSVTYNVVVTNFALNGQTFLNSAAIQSADNDQNYNDNYASVTTTITDGCIPPSLSSSPAGLTNCAGTTATLSVTLNGTTPSYQWRKGGTKIAGATGSSYAINSTTLADSGSFDVVITNSCGSVTSSPAALVVQPATSASGPADQTVCPGATVAFSAVASGTGPFTYQWFKNTAPLGDQTNSSLMLSNVTEGDAGAYCVQVSGACNSVTNCATLGVYPPVIVSAPPASATNCPGTTANFTVNASGNGLSYQWYKGASPLSGRTDGSLTLPGVSAADAGTYIVVLSGTCNSVTNSATLTVNDNVVVSNPPASLTNCPGSTANFTVNSSGTGLSYQWYKGASPMPGRTDSTLTLPGVTAADAATYSVVLSATCNTLTNSASLTVNDNVAVSTPPASTTNCPGSTATFTVNASGTGLSYQWYKGASPMPGRTDSTLTLPGVTAADAATYSVVLSATCNTLTNSAALTVNENVSVSSPPTSLTNCPGSTATFRVNASGTGLSYQWHKGSSPMAGRTDSSLTLPGVTAADAATYSVVLSGSCNSITNSASLTVNDNVAVSTPPASTTNCPGSTATFTANASGTGLSYQWYKGSNPLPGRTDSTLTLLSVAATDAATYSVVLSGTCNSLTNSAALTVNDNVVVSSPPASRTNCPGTTANFSVGAAGTGLSYQWYKGSSPMPGRTDSTLTLPGVTAADAATYSVVLSGTCNSLTNSAWLVVNVNVAVSIPPASRTNCPGSTATFTVNANGTGLSYQWYKGSSPMAGRTDSTLTLLNVAAADAATYSVVLSGTCNSLTNSAWLVVNDNVAVSISPASRTNCPGSTATFTVNASGTGLSYQWYKGSSPMAGRTDSTLTLPSVAAADAATYSVVLSGTCNSITNSAALTVNQNVVVSSPPASRTNCPGTTANFCVGAAGTGLSYQWYKGASPMPGRTDSTLTLPGVTAADAATYSVVLSGTCNSLTNSAWLVVNDNVAVFTPPASRTNCPGTTANFSVGATGTGLSYQWYKGSSPMPGRTDGTLSLPSVGLTDVGTYSVVVSGLCGSPLTNSASLALNQEIAVSSPPLSGASCPGTTASLSVTATGTGLSYQWFKDGALLVGASQSSLNLTNVSAADEGTYSVLLSGTCGHPLTNSANFTVYQNVAISTPPSNSIQCPGGSASFDVSATGTGLTYQWYKAASAIAGRTARTLTLTNVSIADGGTYSVAVSGTCNTITNFATLIVNANLAISSPVANLTNCPGTTATFIVGASGSGLAYQWHRGTSPLAGRTDSTLILTNVTVADAGTYRVVVSGACGLALTNDASLVLNQNVAVSVVPANATNCPGTPASFSVSASGTGLGYQWFKGGSPLAGRTESTLTLSNVSAGDAGTYTVAIGGLCGNPLTNGATLTVNTPTTADPLPTRTFCPGDSLVLNAVAHGTGPFSYSWSKDGKPLPAGNASSWTITSATVLDAGAYSVVVSGSCNTATTTGTLTANSPTTATSMADQTACFGQDATFTTVAGGTSPFSCVWKKAGQVLAGETNQSLVIHNVKAADAGTYTVEISGLCSSVTRSANLAVQSDGLASPATFANPAPIAIADFSPASPYPSPITVSCVPNPLTSVVVTLTNLTHTYASDLDILLVGPSGQAVMLMSDAGGATALNGVTLGFSDAGAATLPENTLILSGVYKPTNYSALDNMPGPAPLGPYGTALADFTGTDANGTWALYVVDDARADTGILAGGWSLTLTWGAAPPVTPPPQITSPTLTGNGAFQATLQCQSGITYIIEASPDLVNWTPILTNTVVGTAWNFVDPDGANLNRRFYRAVCAP